VLVCGGLTNVDLWWDHPDSSHFLNGLASFARLIVFDKRGVGLSERTPHSGMWTLEQRMDDLRAVMDAAGSEEAVVMGVSEGGPMSVLFAATYPERVRSLVLYGSFAKLMKSADYPWGWDPEAQDERIRYAQANWGDLGDSLFLWAPSMFGDPSARSWWNRFLTNSASPASFERYLRLGYEIDVRDVLPTVNVPTLVIHRVDDALISVGNGRYLADHIPEAKYVELPGQDHLWFWGDADEILRDVRGFLTGVRASPQPDRVLKTILFTDIVGSTKSASRLGHSRWYELLDQHKRSVRRELEGFRGEEVETTGDGFLAAFDGPARAIRCACSIRDGARNMGLEIRAGLHTGECEVLDDSLQGIALHIGNRVCNKAGPGEVLVSQTVKDLVAGSEIAFDLKESSELKGVPGTWNLFAVAPS
ncbi:MAG: adenylate/guanylate cyclase domain-containing protein, partial [Actinobacteria bacterium]|nr:adenylate/guanylate cyclase domain-containing protein [Acidobacteriota bacterium]MCA1708705.1 adenylate/guanylate cyclase domain-containing protein [Actinomycetota bacterium]